MKKMLALLLILLLPLPALAEKADSFPAAFQVKYTVKDKLNQQTYLSWEYVQTAQSAVDDFTAEINDPIRAKYRQLPGTGPGKLQAQAGAVPL